VEKEGRLDAFARLREAAQKVLEILKNLFQEVLKPSETPGRRGPAGGFSRKKAGKRTLPGLFSSLGVSATSWS
jgi:hypothetical protein